MQNEGPSLLPCERAKGMLSHSPFSPINQLISPHYWLARSWLHPVVKKSPLAARLLCVGCLFLGKHMMGDVTADLITGRWEWWRRTGVLQSQLTQRHTEAACSKGQRREKWRGWRSRWTRWFFFATISIGWPLCYPSFLPPPPPPPLSFFLVADLSWVKQKR